jgi:hypothetical protein
MCTSAHPFLSTVTQRRQDFHLNEKPAHRRPPQLFTYLYSPNLSSDRRAVTLLAPIRPTSQTLANSPLLSSQPTAAASDLLGCPAAAPALHRAILSREKPFRVCVVRVFSIVSINLSVAAASQVATSTPARGALRRQGERNQSRLGTASRIDAAENSIAGDPWKTKKKKKKKKKTVVLGPQVVVFLRIKPY